jgi:tRNA threonylcarbamoyladenosine biosynthesis protein TsaE
VNPSIRPCPVADVRTGSPDATRSLAGALADSLRPGDVVLLIGDLGAGKTTFAQGVAAGLGVDEPVTSPTFTLVRPYQCRSRSSMPVTTLLHADLYRLEHLREVVDLDLHELVEDAAVALVEWGDLGAPALGRDSIEVHLERAEGDDERRVVIAVPSSWAEDRIDRLDHLEGCLRRWSASDTLQSSPGTTPLSREGD